MVIPQSEEKSGTPDRGETTASAGIISCGMKLSRPSAAITSRRRVRSAFSATA